MNKYFTAFILLVLSFFYIFFSNDSGGGRVFVNLLTFAGIYGLAAIGINVHFKVERYHVIKYLGGWVGSEK